MENFTRIYENKNNIKFNLEIKKANIPKDADYFGFIIQTKVENDDKINEYKALVKKTLCQNENKALKWLKFTGFNFLYEILDTYDCGNTLLLLPNSNGDWYIL